jgi:hypothetical protein
MEPMTTDALAPPSRLRFLASTQSLLLLTAAAFLLADLAIVFIGFNGDFGYDFDCCYRQAGVRLAADPATLYDWSSTYTFRYSPWAAALLAPLGLVSVQAAPWVWLVVKTVVLGATATAYAKPWTGSQRLLVTLCVLFFPPLVHDLVIGNVSVFTVAVLLILLRSRRPAAGGLLGLLLLLAPKPHLIPLAAWLVVRRPRAAIAMLAVVLAGALAGILTFGADLWIAYARTFAEPLERTFTANIGFSGLFGPAGVVVGAAVALVVLVLAVRRSDAIGLGLAIISGVLAGPYTFIHYLSGVIVALEPLLRARPRWLAPFPWLLIVFPLIPVWLVGLAGVLGLAPVPRRDDEAAAAPPAAAPG